MPTKQRTRYYNHNDEEFYFVGVFSVPAIVPAVLIQTTWILLFLFTIYLSSEKNTLYVASGKERKKQQINYCFLHRFNTANALPLPLKLTQTENK